MKSRLILPLILSSLTSCLSSSLAASEDIPLVGMASDGTEIEFRMPRKILSEKFTGALSTVHDSALPALRTSSENAKWKLQTVVIGVGFGLQAGIGPVIQAKFAPRFHHDAHCDFNQSVDR